MTSEAKTEIDLLRHTIATLAYRGGKTLRGAPDGFATFRANEQTRTPIEILAHIGDLFDWALTLASGKPGWNDAKPQTWKQETARFFEVLKEFDNYLASGKPLACSREELFQGPVADALTHVGQIALLRRIAGAPIRGENYFKADIDAGRVGAEQSPARMEFD